MKNQWNELCFASDIHNKKLREIKGTRKSIGGTQYKKLNRTFENEIIQLEEGDSFYFYSDGFVDQMGGDDGMEKLGSKRVREMMNELNHDDITKVSKTLISTFEAWMGTTQQLDDVLLIGVQV